MRTNLTFPTTSREPSLNTMKFLHCEWYDYQEFPDEIIEALLSELFFTRRMKMLSRTDGFMLYGKLGVDFFSTFELLYPNMKVRLRLIRARRNFYMISDNPIVSLGIVDWSLDTRHISLKDDYHKKRLDMLAYTRVEFNYLEILVEIFINPARQNQFVQENIFNIAPVRRIAVIMKTNSAFKGSHTENPFWCQQFNLRQIKTLRGGQPIVNFDAADNCRLYFTTMKAMNFQDDIPSIATDKIQRPLCTSVLFDFDAECYWKVSLPRTSWRTTEAGAKLDFTSRTRYWTLCNGRTNVFGCSWQVWCFWKKHLKWIMFPSSNLLTVSQNSSIGTVALFPLTMFQLLSMTLFPLSIRNPAICRVSIG